MPRLIIFTHPDELPKNSSQLSLLNRECQLIPEFTIELLNINSPKGFMNKRRFHIQKSGQCAVTDDYRRLIVRLNKLPVSFFELREWLAQLGYHSTAKQINWDTEISDT